MKLKLAFLLTLVTLGVHFYLTMHFYDLSFGVGEGGAVCNISTKFNCDTVTASSYSSLFGMPIALWGLVTNAVLAMFLLVWLLGWSANVSRLGRYANWLAIFIAATSIVMGSLSMIFVGAYCIFCMTAYLLSFITAFLIYKSQEPSQSPASEDFLALFSTTKSYLAAIIVIPAIVYMLNYSFLGHYGAQELPQVIKDTMAEWRTNPVVPMTTEASLVLGNPNAKMVFSEFADFRCGHCRHARGPIEAFMAAHPDVQMRFYTFPLDNKCNDAIQGGDGISCYLAKSVYCTEKIAKRGWDLHHYIYDDQDAINGTATLPFAKEQVETFWTTQKIDKAPIDTCIEDAATDTAIRAQAKLGADAGVKGTPTFYVNGKKLTRGSLIPVLEAVHSEAAN